LFLLKWTWNFYTGPLLPVQWIRWCLGVNNTWASLIRRGTDWVEIQQRTWCTHWDRTFIGLTTKNTTCGLHWGGHELQTTTTRCTKVEISNQVNLRSSRSKWIYQHVWLVLQYVWQ
jgi:hypothetical protein